MKIGEFAKLSRATIRTLRYYDDLDLLKPDSIDKFTGYRIYSSEKLQQMRQIQILKEIGFTLLEIKVFLSIDKENHTGKIEFVSAKRSEIELEKQKTESRLTALDEFIGNLKEGENKPMEKKNYAVPCSDDEVIIQQRNAIKEGLDKFGEKISEAVKLVKICANTSRFGAVDENGKVYIWGNNYHGQCDVPDDLPPIADIGIGACHAVALDENGKLHGWGDPQCGEIDFPDDLPKIVSIAVKAYNTRALSEDGRVFSWGENNRGNQKYVPKNMGAATQIAAGFYDAYALNTEEEIFSWGISNELCPAAETKVAAMAATEYDFAYLGADGKVYSDIKHRMINKKFLPKPEMSDIKKLAGGRCNFAAIDARGKLYVWGEYTEMPDACCIINIPSNLPRLTDLAIGDEDILCLGEDSKIYAWGNHVGIVPEAFNGFKDGPVFEPAETVDVHRPRNVYTFEELSDAVRDKIRNITIKKNMTVPCAEPVINKDGSSYIPMGDSFYISNDNTVTIDEGVTLTVKSINFFIYKKLINKGTIDGTGRILIFDDIDGSGKVITDNGLTIDRRIVSVDEIGKYLAAGSFYTSVSFANSEDFLVEIASDLLIPRGKSLWLNGLCTLQVNEGVTLTIEGDVKTYRDPIINGTVTGNLLNFSKTERDVRTFEELCDAIPQKIIAGKKSVILSTVTIKDNITVTDVNFKKEYHLMTALIIDEGVTLTVNSPDFTVLGEFINNGTINGTGCLNIDAPIGGTGTVDTSGGLSVAIFDVNTNEISQYLAEDSIYTSIIYTNIEKPHSKTVFFPKREQSFIEINSDLVIPKGKSIWLHVNCVLKVCEGAALKVNGKIETYNEPVIEGTVIGDIMVIDVDAPRDVYTYAEFYEAARDKINEITVKADITVTFSQDYISVNTLIIDKSVTLTGDACNIGVDKKLINNGTINGTGRIEVNERVDGENGIDQSAGLDLYVKVIDSNEISQYLTEDSVYTSVIIYTKLEKSVLAIDSDLIIPKGKSLWLNGNCTLKVSEGAVLKIDGKIETYNNPIIEGIVIGSVTILKRRSYF